MVTLGIPIHLSNRSDRHIRVMYKKYKAHLQASQTLAKMTADGTWTAQQPTATELIELFTSKSMWHSHYKPAFSKISDYPEMVQWLEDSDEKGSDLDVWGLEKSNYNLVDLRNFVANGTLGEKKGKEKEKEKEKGKGKKKEKNDLAEGSSKKGKKKVTKNDTSSKKKRA